MNIKEASEILNEAIIDEPSIKSYVYISAEDINIAINIVLNELQKKEEKINELQNELLTEKMKNKKESTTTSILGRLGRTVFLEPQNE